MILMVTVSPLFNYTAAEVADAFDARIAQSRREGRDDFARELHDEMKRRT